MADLTWRAQDACVRESKGGCLEGAQRALRMHRAAACEPIRDAAWAPIGRARLHDYFPETCG